MSVETITESGRRRYRWSFSRRIEGLQIRRSKVFPIGTTRADAETLARKWEAEIYAVATGAKKPQVTIGECVRRHITDRNTSWKDRRKRVMVLEKWRSEYDDVPVSEVHDWSIQIANYMRASRDRRGHPKPALTDGSVRNVLAYVRAAMRYCQKIGVIETGHVDRLVIPGVHNERHNYPDRRQMLQIARKCKERQVRAMIRIAFYSGMRQTEIMTAAVTRNGFSLNATKNGKPRIIPIHPRVAVLSRRIRFDITIGTVYYHWKIARRDAGYPGTRFHDLRHAAASEMINAGEDLYTVGGVLGHISMVSTKRYAHLVTGRLNTAINKIGRR